MPRLRIFLFGLIAFMGSFLALDKATTARFNAAEILPPAPATQGSLPAERAGERIVYGVKLNGISLGRATFTQLAREEVNGRLLNVATFETRVTSFWDLEKIYSDPRTYLPVRVERRIKTLAGQEHIVEEYDQENFRLVITKFPAGKKGEEQIIRQKHPLHNSIMLPFYVRDIQGLAPGWTFRAQLPTQSFDIKLVGVETVALPAGRFECFHFRSFPERFEIWVSADERRIPVKIRGSSGIGYTMTMREYAP